MNDGTAFQKRRQLLELLDKGLVMLHLDPRPEDVVVPGWLKTEPVLRLNLAYGFRLPALDVGADGVYAVLSFNRQNFGCTLPWHAVFAMTMPDNGHDGMLWPGSLPPELRPAGEEVEPGASVVLKPALQSVEGEASPRAVALVEPEAEASEVEAPRGGAPEPVARKPALQAVEASPRGVALVEGAPEAAEGEPEGSDEAVERELEALGAVLVKRELDELVERELGDLVERELATPGSAPDEATTVGDPAPPEPSAPRRAHLRLVK